MAEGRDRSSHIGRTRGSDIRLVENPEALLQQRKRNIAAARQRGLNLQPLSGNSDHSADFLDLDIRRGEGGSERDETIFLPIARDQKGNTYAVGDDGQTYLVTDEGVNLRSTEGKDLRKGKRYPKVASFFAWIFGRGKKARAVVPRVVNIDKDKSRLR
ncbi:hypothetical protein HY345_00895 [Candidatus Microgenomates bacterium]|nr:hypothetical protein [Candidatus Microgenomates bacterium]